MVFAGALEERLAAPDDMVAVADGRGRTAQRLLEPLLALEQRQGADILAGQEQRVEDKKLQRAARRIVQRILERLEARDPARDLHGHLAVQQRRCELQTTERVGDRLES